MVRVWLPPDYDGWGETRYPVLYLNDGQNLFEPTTAFAGVHWQVGESAGRLIAEKKISPLIIVGIDNMGRNRVREYIPYRSLDPRVMGPQGQRYPDFLRREVMPLIEKYYCVAKGAGEYRPGGIFAGRADHAVHATGGARSVRAVADREPVTVCGESQNSGRVPAF